MSISQLQFERSGEVRIAVASTIDSFWTSFDKLQMVVRCHMFDPLAILTLQYGFGEDFLESDQNVVYRFERGANRNQSQRQLKIFKPHFLVVKDLRIELDLCTKWDMVKATDNKDIVFSEKISIR